VTNVTTPETEFARDVYKCKQMPGLVITFAHVRPCVMFAAAARRHFFITLRIFVEVVQYFIIIVMSTCRHCSQQPPTDDWRNERWRSYTTPL